VEELHLGPDSPFDPEEIRTVHRLLGAIEASDHPDRQAFHRGVRDHVHRTEAVAEALAAYPMVFHETRLGERRRSLESLVEVLAGATDANFDMFIPTRALVGRALLMAELNCWRMMYHVSGELETRSRVHPELSAIRAEVDRWLHDCVHVKITEEILGAVTMDPERPFRIRERALRYLAQIWEDRLTYRVRNFFPLLDAAWTARRRIRVSVGTLLGVSEICRLIQAGCPPEFVDYFSRPEMSEDERLAFQEFLIGVPTEELGNLERLMEETGRTSLSPEETAAALHREHDPARRPHGDDRHPGVQAYELFRERYLQAAARRMKHLGGPLRTAEEYLMHYFLGKQSLREREPEGKPEAGRGDPLRPSA